LERDTYKVFSQGKIANLTLKNRLVRSATCEAAVTEEGQVTDQMFVIHKNLSEGGTVRCPVATPEKGC
jgi:2,4-dienoyl-CoA reductase-like NADH-dependent reductase (Old Yellow Enzyme family)